MFKEGDLIRPAAEYPKLSLYDAPQDGEYACDCGEGAMVVEILRSADFVQMHVLYQGRRLYTPWLRDLSIYFEKAT